MAGFLQLGDIVQISKAAWDLYQLGWSDNLNAATQYGQFGHAVRGLAESLDSLIRMIDSAYQQVRSGLGSQGAPRWNFASLNDIIGDYQRTIHESRRLLLSNRQYGQTSGPFRNIEWNILIQPQATALQDRIHQHNSKILLVIKPLEIDLLSQIISRLDAVHGRVEQVYGILTSNVPQAVQQQERQLSHTLDCPPVILTRLQRAAEQGNGNQRTTASRPLSDLTDAFLLHLKQSTVNFQPERALEAQYAAPKEYISLLKCVWLMAQIEEHPDLHSADGETHWPSYVKGLKAELSRECWRFDPRCPDQIYAPDLQSLNSSDFSIWPTKAPEPILPPIVQLPAAMMDELLSVALVSPRPSLVQRLVLYRGVGGKMSAVISAVDYDGEDERTDSRTLDFNLENAGLIPLYAVSFDLGPLSVILRTESVMAELAFQHVEELLQFQRAMTGYKVFKDYSQPSVMLELITSDRKTLRVHTAHIQLWISKELEGRASTGPGSDSDADLASRRHSTATSLVSPISPFPGNNHFNFGSTPPSMDPLTNRLGQLSMSPRQTWHSGGAASASSSNGTLRGSSFSQSFPNHAGTSPPQGINRTTSMASVQSTATASTARESISVFSTQSRATQATSVTSRKIAGPVTGTGRAYLNQNPSEPLLVLLLKSAINQGAATNASPFSVVVIQLDEKTAPHYERCSCQSHPDQCDITALERDKGKEDLSASIIEADDLDGWDLMRLRPNPRPNPLSAEASSFAQPLPKLRRLTLKFPTVESRYRLSGRPCSCNKTKTVGELKACLEENHQGLLGELRQFHKKELKRFEAAQRKKKDVVLGPMAQG